MARASKMSQSQTKSAYEMYLSGESVKDIAAAFNVSPATMYRNLGIARKDGDMAQAEVVLAGDKRTGRLVCVSRNGKQFDGTHVTKDGMTHRRKFSSTGPKMAMASWEKWCADLDDECEFMSRVERRAEEAQASEDVPVHEDAPTEEDVSADEEPTEDEPAEEVPAPSEHKPVPYRVPSARRDKPAYLIWTKYGGVKTYGLYQTTEAALADLESLNAVSAFLGLGEVFEVDEAEWRQ